MLGLRGSEMEESEVFTLQPTEGKTEAKTEFACLAGVKDGTAQSEGTRVLATMGRKAVLCVPPCNHLGSPAGKGSDAQRPLLEKWDVSPGRVRPGPAPGKNLLTLKLDPTCCPREVSDPHTVSATQNLPVGKIGLTGIQQTGFLN